jgi:CheY-like chemotaxis protein
VSPRFDAPIAVLVVEDEAPKLAHIQKLIQGLMPTGTVQVARSVNSAIDALERQTPDLLILDMSLPTFDVGERESGGRPQGFGGIEVLRHMMMAELSCPTIVLTGYEAFPREAGGTVELNQLRSDLMVEFSGALRGVLHYNSTYDEWRIELQKILKMLRADENPNHG